MNNIWRYIAGTSLTLAVISGFNGCVHSDQADWDQNWEPMFQTPLLAKDIPDKPPAGSDWVRIDRDDGVFFQRPRQTNNAEAMAAVIQRLPSKVTTTKQLLDQYKVGFGAGLEKVGIQKSEYGLEYIEYTSTEPDPEGNIWRARGVAFIHPKSNKHAIDVFFTMRSGGADFEEEYQSIGKDFIQMHINAYKEN